MKFFGLIACVFFINQSLFSADIYWIGSTTDWDEKDNWSLTSNGSSCGCVPDENDDVILNNGGTSMTIIKDGEKVKIRSLQVGVSQELFIGDQIGGNALLHIDAQYLVDHALFNDGKVIINDSLVITNAQINNLYNLTGIVQVQKEANLYINGSNSLRGVYNTSMFTIEGDGNSFGTVSIMDVSEYAIHNTSVLACFGLIAIQDTSDGGILSYSGLLTSSSGITTIDKFGAVTISNLADQNLTTGIGNFGKFYNNGTCLIESSNFAGISNTGIDSFFNNGTINVSEFAGRGLSNIVSGTFINKGTFDCFAPQNAVAGGIRNTGYIRNESEGVILIHDFGGALGPSGIENSKIFYNQGFIQISNIASRCIWNYGNDSIFESSGNIDISTYFNFGIDILTNFEITAGGTLGVNPN